MIKVGDRVHVKNREGTGVVTGFQKGESIHTLVSVQFPKKAMKVRFSSIKGAKQCTSQD